MQRIAILIFVSLCLATSLSQAREIRPVLTDTPDQQGQPGEATPVVVDVVLHKRDDILRMLQRAEELAMMPNPVERPRQISLVLHGNEIENFKISQYKNNKEIVDLAAKLDAFNVIDVKMCNTMMNQLGVPRKEIPAFIEVVPYGPAEIEKLIEQGFIRL